ncbi:MAG: AAA family ATPase [Endomicrobia bacterium]|nr:AAA family ATPase [Endomicrobiia bacterium]
MLKQIEIYGFKSFAEKTVLYFNDEINGIVGPNGSGKSNIVDAIKWCLGEQSLKEIRAKNLSDVIFSGSETKPPLNWCEVTVVFDNSRGMLAIDYPEVAITRKLYRSGETEYFINRTPCRLKDIKELVLDICLSPDSYSIIPQGKVEFVVSAKPEERRLLFEETAGIAKYKLKREETLRKLERVKLDMARVEDILAYLQEQMSSLEAAVKKAKNYQKYKQELQMLECAYLVQQVETIDIKLKEIQQKYFELSSQYASLAGEIANKEAEIANIKLEMTDIEKKFLQTKDEHTSVEKEISSSTQKLENYKNLLSNCEIDIQRLKQEIDDLNLRTANYIKELSETESEKQQIEQQLKQIETIKTLHYNEYESYRSQIVHQQTILQQKNKQIAEIAYKKVKLKNDINTISREIQKLNIEIAAINKDISTNKKNLEVVKEELISIDAKISHLAQQKNDLNTKILSLNEQITTLQQHLNEKKELYEKKNKEFYLLTSKFENMVAEYPICGYDLQKLITILKDYNMDNLCVPVNSVVKIKPEHYSLISSFLGNKLFWLIVDTETDAKKIVDILKQNFLGYATLIIKQNLQYIVDKISVDNSILQLIQYPSEIEPVIKFLFSDTVYTDGVITNGVIIHAGEKTISGQQGDITSIQQELNTVSIQIKELNEEIQTLTKQIEFSITQKTQQEKELIFVETQIKQLEIAKKEKEEYLLSLTELTDVLQTNINQLNENFISSKAELDTLDTELKNLDNEEKKLREEIDNLVSIISELQSNKVVEEYVKINSEHIRLQEQYNSLLKELKSKQELILFNEQKVKMLETEIEELQKTKLTTQQEYAKEETKLEELIKTNQLVVSKLTELSAQLEEKRNLLSVQEQQVKQMLEEKEQLQRQLSNIEIEKNTYSRTKENHINWLEDKYSLKFEEAKELYSSIKDVDVQTIEKLKKKIESMSAINLAAPEEYAQLEEKYNYLITQQQDLLKSQQDLKEAMSKINQQISDTFRDTFYKVKENFIKLCSILFEGGKADLILTDEDNILESGIEIIVQPPGKKLQNINLLSGGEKSLVAFALLFAFFMVKPSPVCILDEADAQLDETNVVRFMKLLKDFSKDTKFILITHNTRTMEFINTLYGITMEELGVSKVIAIKLQHVETATSV